MMKLCLQNKPAANVNKKPATDQFHSKSLHVSLYRYAQRHARLPQKVTLSSHTEGNS